MDTMVTVLMLWKDAMVSIVPIVFKRNYIYPVRDIRHQQKKVYA